MNAVLAIWRREVLAYFNSAVAYLFVTVFLLLAGWFFFSGFFIGGQAEIRGLLELIPLLFIFFVPALTMRLISEEWRSGTLELLVTYPVRDHEIVLGKFLAALSLLAVTIAGTLAWTLTVSALGDLDTGMVLTGYLGMLLMGAAYTAIGLLASSLTPNQIVGFILGIAMILVLFLLDKVLFFIPARLVGLFEYLAVDAHYHSMIRGVVDSRDLVYYGTLIALALYLAGLSLGRRRGN
ncbi:MAG: ABC transporter permease [bacterium]|jgi:ABC-2 type transport system permease protein|nr:ABC transporter permease [bacterium]